MNKGLKIEAARGTTETTEASGAASEAGA